MDAIAPVDGQRFSFCVVSFLRRMEVLAPTALNNELRNFVTIRKVCDPEPSRDKGDKFNFYLSDFQSVCFIFASPF